MYSLYNGGIGEVKAETKTWISGNVIITLNDGGELRFRPVDGGDGCTDYYDEAPYIGQIDNITSVYIEDGVNRVWKFNMQYAYNMESIRFPSNIVECAGGFVVGDYENSTLCKLQSVDIPEGFGWKSDSWMTFSNCMCLDSIVLPTTYNSSLAIRDSAVSTIINRSTNKFFLTINNSPNVRSISYDGDLYLDLYSNNDIDIDVKGHLALHVGSEAVESVNIKCGSFKYSGKYSCINKSVLETDDANTSYLNSLISDSIDADVYTHFGSKLDMTSIRTPEFKYLSHVHYTNTDDYSPADVWYIDNTPYFFIDSAVHIPDGGVLISNTGDIKYSIIDCSVIDKNLEIPYTGNSDIVVYINSCIMNNPVIENGIISVDNLLRFDGTDKLIIKDNSTKGLLCYKINVESKIIYEKSYSGVRYELEANGTLHVYNNGTGITEYDKGIENTYRNRIYKVIFHEGVWKIPRSFCRYNETITDVDLGDISYIADGCFTWAPIDNLIFTSKIDRIGEECFSRIKNSVLDFSNVVNVSRISGTSLQSFSDTHVTDIVFGNNVVMLQTYMSGAINKDLVLPNQLRYFTSRLTVHGDIWAPGIVEALSVDSLDDGAIIHVSEKFNPSYLNGRGFINQVCRCVRQGEVVYVYAPESSQFVKNIGTDREFTYSGDSPYIKGGKCIVVTDVAPNVIDKTLNYTYKQDTNIEIRYNLGFGNKAATDINKIMIDGSMINYISDSNVIVIEAEELSDMSVGEHTVLVGFDNGVEVDNIVLNFMRNSVPSMSSQILTFDGENPADVTFIYSLGSGDLKAASVTEVKLGDSVITPIITDTKITISVDYLSNLNNGDYPLTITLDNDTKLEGSKVTIINSQVKDPSFVVEDITFDAENPEDVTITIDLGYGSTAAIGVTSVALNGEDIPFTFTDGTLTISKDDLLKLKNDTYALIITLDTDKILEGSNIIIMNSKVGIAVNPSVTKIDATFDFNAPNDITTSYDLGDGDTIATGINSVKLSGTSVMFETTDTDIVILQDSLLKLKDGKYQVTVIFDTDYSVSAGTIIVVNSTVGVKPQEPVDSVDESKFAYEYYIDKVNNLEIPIQTDKVTSVRVDDIDIPDDSYELTDGTIAIKADYMNTLDAGEHKLVINGKTYPVVLWETASDRTGPNLLYNHIIFKDEDISMEWAPGSDANEPTAVLALQLNSSLYLPNGNKIPYSEKAVEKLIDTYENTEIATPNNATKPSQIATPNNIATPSNVEPLSITKSIARAFLTDNAIFELNDSYVDVSGKFLSGLNLVDGDYKVGVVFDSTVPSVNLSKVILTVPKKEEKPDKPQKPDEPEKPTEPEEPDEPEKPIEPDKPEVPDKPTVPVKPSRPAYTGGGSSSSDTIRVKPGYNADGSWNSKYILPKKSATGSLGKDYIWRDTSGNVLSNSWVWSGNSWYRTNVEGKAVTGWFEDIDHKWYVLSADTCIMKTGWYFEQQDQKWYFLSPLTGSMLVGWQFIDGKYYYLTEAVTEPSYSGNNVLGWIYNPEKCSHPYGSMWAGETTPDNYKVDASGAWIK